MQECERTFQCHGVSANLDPTLTLEESSAHTKVFAVLHILMGFIK